MTELNTQSTLLLKKLIEYYREHKNIHKIIPILNGESKISIRIIDWFVTNYSKEHFTLYPLQRNGKSYRFKVYIDYKLKLKSFSKKRFDPFCRWERITLPLNIFNETTIDTQNTEYIQTTVGQLNFFRWALENNILDYVEQNIQDIELDLLYRINNNKRTQKNKQNVNKTIVNTNKTRKRREELSISAIKSVKKEDVEVIVKFN